ncbi:MAG: Glycosyl transferase, family 2 [candidate division WS6 bacterium GW2011_GWF2_39_15]|uniref:Glycosyl transferase, family 2 n=1 Tax=candidate division WS6 bacterium GW2011_GWF2_39_15 TaxID=1619100 RepID=A0A0G0MNQ4_9BACT|nr:MAG: Glycosyl transferase, family 2 [candidate division WS6 bacterium GW2011_GWF2_39_15]
MKNQTPFFTLVTCCYNRTRFLDECLKSIEKQSFKNFEHVIIDGFSTDGTYDMVLSYKEKKKTYPVRIIQSPPKGISNAFNIGINHSKGQYLILINSDDYLYNEHSLESAYNILKENPEIMWLQGLTCFNIKDKEHFFSNRRLLKPFYPLIVSCHCPVNHQAAVVHRDVYRKYGGFDENHITHMDTELMIRLFGKVNIDFADIKLGVWRAHNDAMTVALPFFRTYLKNMKMLYKKHGNIPIVSTISKYRKYKGTLHSV